MTLAVAVRGRATLSRFIALHVFVVPGLVIAFVTLHLVLVIKVGINEWPMPGRIVRRETYVAEYHQLLKRDGIPYFPAAIWEDVIFAGVVLLSIPACPPVFRPLRPAGPPRP